MKFDLRNYFKLLIIEGIAIIVWVLQIPSIKRHIVFMGFSKFQIIMFAINLLILLGFGLILYLLYKKQKFETRINLFLDKALKKDGHRTVVIGFLFFGSIVSLLFLWESFSSTVYLLASINYYQRLIPWVLWAGLIGIQTVVYLIESDPISWRKYFKVHRLGLIVLIVILLVGGVMHVYLWELPIEQWDTSELFAADGKFDLEKQDIYAIFLDGERLQEGENPYGRVQLLEGGNQWNYGNATYFPLFYLLTWFTQSIGLQSIFYWLIFWRVVFLIANLAIAALLYLIIYHRFNNILMAIFTIMFWLFNRWTLHITMIYHIEFIAIFFFLLSLSLWPKNQILSVLAFGLSMGIKQIAIFMVPIYLIWIWQETGLGKIKRFAGLVLAMGIIPFLVSLPFLIWDAGGYVDSVFLSATRVAESHFGIPAVDSLLGMGGAVAKLPMLILMTLVFVLVWQKKIGPFVAALLVMVVFVDFNSVLFRQYMAWVVPLLPLAVMEYKGFDLAKIVKEKIVIP